MEECAMNETKIDVESSPTLCAENISKLDAENDASDENSLPGITSLSERSTSSTEWSSALLREGSERWELDDDSSQSDVPSAEKTNEPLQTIFECNTERVVDVAANEEATATSSSSESVVDDLVGSRAEHVEAAVTAAAAVAAAIVEEPVATKALSWGTVEMRLYPIILGDHPDVWQGPPVSVDWEHIAVLKQEIDDYEDKRKPRKIGMDLRMSWVERRRMLLRLGIHESDIVAVSEDCYKIRCQREQTAAPWRLKLLKAEQAKQSFFRKITKSLFQKRTKSPATKD